MLLTMTVLLVLEAGGTGKFPPTDVDRWLSEKACFSLKTFLKEDLLQVAFVFRKVNGG